jgi:hypothetical protein
MTKTEYEKLKEQAEQAYNAAILKAKKERDDRLNALKTVWKMIEANLPEYAQRPPSQNTVTLENGQEQKEYGLLTNKIKDALSQVPETFTRNDILKIVGTANENSLAGCFKRLERQGLIQKIEQGQGRTPSKYKKTMERLFDTQT